MKTISSFRSLTLVHAFEQFLEVSSFARRTRESYTEDLAPLLAESGQAAHHRQTGARCLSRAPQNVSAPGICRCALLGTHGHHLAYRQTDGVPGHRAGPDYLRSLRHPPPSSPG